MTTRSLQLLTDADRMLAEVTTIDDAMTLITMAERARLLAQQSRLGTSAINHATVIKVKAERRLADCVDEGQAKGEIATKDTGRPMSSESEYIEQPATLAELGIQAPRLNEARKFRDRYTDDDLDQLAAEADANDVLLSRDALLKGKVHVSNNSGEIEWYTPPEYIAAAVKVLGKIDLDPASSPLANKIVKAKQFFTVDDDGLTQEWKGRVWMNPPYSTKLVGHFTQKLIDEFREGNVAEAIVLVNNATDTEWFQNLAWIASCICFPNGRVRFISPDGEMGAPLQGQAILYLGSKRTLFGKAFDSFGIITDVRRDS